MTRKTGFYIDIDKANRRGIGGLVEVKFNGKKIDKAIAAKSGKNGFVEYIVQPLKMRRNEIVTKKVRGNVKVSIGLTKRPKLI